ncbi:Crp/Fnr family transcriptional regulator [Rhodocyclaceae bacterium]
MDCLVDGYTLKQDKRSSRRQNVQEILRLVPLFSGLNTTHLDHLASQTETRVFEKRECIFLKGGVPRCLYVVISGQVKVSIPTVEGHEKVISVFGAIQVISDASLFHGDNYLTNAETLESSLIYCIPKNAVIELIQTDVRFAESFINEVCMKVKLLINEISTCAVKNSVQRTIEYLLRCLPDNHQESHAFITLGMSKQLIASQLNFTPETLSRIFHDLVDVGLIEVDGKTILIKDINKFRLFASAC